MFRLELGQCQDQDNGFVYESPRRDRRTNVCIDMNFLHLPLVLKFFYLNYFLC